jgi:hypothetical protein
LMCVKGSAARHFDDYFNSVFTPALRPKPWHYF